jgi:hypothetical protein
VATAFVRPAILVVLFAVHHRQDVDDAPAVVYAADQSKFVVPYLKHDTVSDLIRRAECLSHSMEMIPARLACQLVPGAEVSFGIGATAFSRFPELDNSGPRYHAHAAPAADSWVVSNTLVSIIAICDKSSAPIAACDERFAQSVGQWRADRARRFPAPIDVFGRRTSKITATVRSLLAVKVHPTRRLARWYSAASMASFSFSASVNSARCCTYQTKQKMSFLPSWLLRMLAPLSEVFIGVLRGEEFTEAIILE